MNHMAWIDNGVVTNFVVIRPEQVSEFESDAVRLVDPGALDVQTGDTWDGERFYRDGLPVEPLPPEPAGETLPPDVEAALTELGVDVYEAED